MTTFPKAGEDSGRQTPVMLQNAGGAQSPAASAAVIYKYTGLPLDTANWDAVFGPAPTQMTATVEVVRPFPEDPNFVGGWVGGIAAGTLTGIISASISDGVRTFTPDILFLSGYGTNIREWLIGGGFPPDPGASDARELATANISARGQVFIGDFALFQQPGSPGPKKTIVKAGAPGQWTAMPKS